MKRIAIDAFGHADAGSRGCAFGTAPTPTPVSGRGAPRLRSRASVRARTRGPLAAASLLRCGAGAP